MKNILNKLEKNKEIKSIKKIKGKLNKSNKNIYIFSPDNNLIKEIKLSSQQELNNSSKNIIRKGTLDCLNNGEYIFNPLIPKYFTLKNITLDKNIHNQLPLRIVDGILELIGKEECLFHDEINNKKIILLVSEFEKNQIKDEFDKINGKLYITDENSCFFLPNDEFAQKLNVIKSIKETLDVIKNIKNNF